MDYYHYVTFAYLRGVTTRLWRRERLLHVSGRAERCQCALSHKLLALYRGDKVMALESLSHAQSPSFNTMPTWEEWTGVISCVATIAAAPKAGSFTKLIRILLPF